MGFISVMRKGFWVNILGTISYKNIAQKYLAVMIPICFSWDNQVVV